jgi:nitroimidazol reductase NimA-like FMN-containing flavoprotein (pyridoxamine 5'-phosphate oxidase superfamily)
MTWTQHTEPAPRWTELSIDDSMRMLEVGRVGRLAYIAGEQPQILPVNYLFHEGAIIFRTTYGQVLDTIGAGARVAFEVDSINEASHTGWSVVVRGKAEEIWMPDELAEVRALHVDTWAPGERLHYVRILPAWITGRRIE